MSRSSPERRPTLEEALAALRAEARAKAVMRARAEAKVLARIRAETALAAARPVAPAKPPAAGQRGFATNWLPDWLIPAWLAPRSEIWVSPSEVRIALTGAPSRGRGPRTMPLGAGVAGTWQGALAVLGETLADGALAGSRARITISNQFVRYAVLPWSDAILDEDERRAAAQGTFKMIYGDVAGDWAVTLYEQGAGRPLVAAAIDRPLREGLAALATANRIRIAAVTPSFAYAFNAARARIPRSDAWFACAEREHLCLGYLRRGAWELIRSRRAKGALAGQLVPMLEQARVADGVQRPAGAIYLHAPGREPLTLPSRLGWKVVNLRTGRAKGRA